MHFEDFAAGGSFLHRMDPRVKIVSLFFYAAVVAVSTGLSALAAALAFSVLLTWSADVSVVKVAQRLVVVNAFVLFLWVMLPFSIPGDPVFTVLGLAATKQGFHQTLIITLKTNAIILATIALLGTSPIFSLVHALVHLHVPDKLVHLFFFCYRYISVLHMEYTRLRSAMKIRCFKPGTTMHTYRSFAYLLGMLFVKSYDRSGRIYNAMLCRGFKGQFYTLHHFHFRPADAAMFVLMTLFTLGLVIVQTGVAR